jgi:hypothetical protein
LDLIQRKFASQIDSVIDLDLDPMNVIHFGPKYVRRLCSKKISFQEFSLRFEILEAQRARESKYILDHQIIRNKYQSLDHPKKISSIRSSKVNLGCLIHSINLRFEIPKFRRAREPK